MQGHALQELLGVDTAERKVSETWLVLEFCSKGSLQDALDRYALLCLICQGLVHTCYHST